MKNAPFSFVGKIFGGKKKEPAQKIPDELRYLNEDIEYSVSKDEENKIAQKKRALERKFRHNDGVLTEYTGSDEVVIIPDFITELDFASLRQCAQMKTVIFHEKLTRIGREAFSMSGLSKVEIPETVTTIEKRAFAQCMSLEKAVINADVRAIPEQCFSGCSALKEVEIKDGIETLQTSAFNSCESLSRIVIPESVEYIGDFCFSGCTALKEVVIKNPGCVIGNRAFYLCPCATINEKL